MLSPSTGKDFKQGSKNVEKLEELVHSEGFEPPNLLIRRTIFVKVYNEPEIVTTMKSRSRRTFLVGGYFGFLPFLVEKCPKSAPQKHYQI